MGKGIMEVKLEETAGNFQNTVASMCNQRTGTLECCSLAWMLKSRSNLDWRSFR